MTKSMFAFRGGSTQENVEERTKILAKWTTWTEGHAELTERVDTDILL